MSLHPKVAESFDEIDAAIFSGDQFHNKEDKDQLAYYVNRWKKELAYIEQHIRENQYVEEGFETYITEPGESVSGIAMRKLGDEDLWKSIIEINDEFSNMKAWEYFPVGTVIRLKLK